MWIFGAILKNPEDFAHLLKLKVASVAANRAIPADPNLAFCYQMLGRASRSFSVVLQQLDPNLRNPVSLTYLHPLHYQILLEVNGIGCAHCTYNMVLHQYPIALHSMDLTSRKIIPIE